MARKGYQGITVKQAVADKLEKKRIARGLKTIPETIAVLIEEDRK